MAAQGSRTIAHYSEMKRNWFALLALLLLTAPAASQGQTCRTTITRQMPYGMTITITGYSGSGGDVTIPAAINSLPVTSLAPNAFLGDTSLTSVTIPGSITSVGVGAFGDCSSLTNVTMASGVTSIGEAAFSDCFGLTSVSIPASVTSFGGLAFENCTSLTSVTIPASVTNIEAGAFLDCITLTSVYFAGSAPIVGSTTFLDDNATVYYLPGTTGWSNTFAGLPAAQFQSPYSFTVSADETITINGYTGPGGTVIIPAFIIGLPVTSIGNFSFSECITLTNIIIPPEITYVGNAAFIYCTGLTNITIPGTVTTLGSSAFAYCTNLENVHFTGDAPDVVNPVFLFFDDNSVTVFYWLGCSGWSSSLREPFHSCSESI